MNRFQFVMNRRICNTNQSIQQQDYSRVHIFLAPDCRVAPTKLSVSPRLKKKTWIHCPIQEDEEAADEEEEDEDDEDYEEEP